MKSCQIGLVVGTVVLFAVALPLVIMGVFGLTGGSQSTESEVEVATIKNQLGFYDAGGVDANPAAISMVTLGGVALMGGVVCAIFAARK